MPAPANAPMSPPPGLGTMKEYSRGHFSIVMMIVLSGSLAFTSLMTSALRKGGFASCAKTEQLSVLSLVILSARIDEHE